MPGGVVPPASVVLEWIHLANPTNPYRRPWTLGYVSVFLGTLAVLAVSLRLYLRLRVLRNGGMDDLFIAATMVRGKHSPAPTRSFRDSSDLAFDVVLCWSPRR